MVGLLWAQSKDFTLMPREQGTTLLAQLPQPGLRLGDVCHQRGAPLRARSATAVAASTSGSRAGSRRRSAQPRSHALVSAGVLEWARRQPGAVAVCGGEQRSDTGLAERRHQLGMAVALATWWASPKRRSTTSCAKARSAAVSPESGSGAGPVSGSGASSSRGPAGVSAGVAGESVSEPVRGGDEVVAALGVAEAFAGFILAQALGARSVPAPRRRTATRSLSTRRLSPRSRS